MFLPATRSTSQRLCSADIEAALLKIAFLFLAVVGLQFCTGVFTPPALAQAGKPWEEYVSSNSSSNAIKILFIGHSKFYINNMPKMFNSKKRTKGPNRKAKMMP